MESKILSERKYEVIQPEEYQKTPVGSYIILDGVIDEKPVLINSPSKKPLKIQVVRYYINTTFSIDDVKIKYEGPVFLRKGEKVTVWGKKEHDYLDAKQIETGSFIIKID